MCVSPREKAGALLLIAASAVVSELVLSVAYLVINVIGPSTIVSISPTFIRYPISVWGLGRWCLGAVARQQSHLVFTLALS
jgi:hypothetical protein